MDVWNLIGDFIGLVILSLFVIFFGPLVLAALLLVYAAFLEAVSMTLKCLFGIDKYGGSDRKGRKQSFAQKPLSTKSPDEEQNSGEAQTSSQENKGQQQ